ncbi:CHAT domain-containing protein [Parapedobacter sp. SGR-10]|uniref:CHAT domain-containing protein n=1 Tax=Parapedobacter sp. SGR-10 TaxID=2710879 RepID=UPI0013D7DD01|nr:CHAT domain-containing tetratricopeptide repeat protein [Parapedobacter sp. SGR-10]NGF55276.1 CHAT domain-containing protein [Parapedobacter sp. SGR-10]
MRINRSVYVVIGCFWVVTLLQCTSPVLPTVSTNNVSVVMPDSIFEYFENIADTAPERYVHNPDSFLNSLQLHPQSVEQQEMYVYGLIFMAYALKEYGDIYQSVRYYERVLGFIQQHDMKDPAYLDYVIKPLANNYIRIDDNRKAISLLEKTISEIPRDDYTSLSGFTGNLANAYLFNGEPHKAEELLLRTLAYPIPSLSKGLLYNTLSDVLKDDHERSNRYNRLALDEFSKHRLTGDTLVWYTSALGLYAELNNHIQPARKALSVLNQNFPNSQFRTKAKLQQVIANLLYEKGDIQMAKKEFVQAISLFTQALNETYILDYTYTQALVGLARCHSRQDRIDSALYYYQWAIENDFRTQQLITSKRNQINNNIWNRGIIEEMTALSERLLEQGKPKQDLLETLLWCIELSKGRLLINEINRSDNWDKANPELKNAIQTIRNLYQKISQSSDNVQRQALQKQIDQMMIDFQLSERYFETYNYSPDKVIFLKHLHDETKTYYSYFVHEDSTVTVIGRLGQQYVYHKVEDPAFIDRIGRFKERYFGLSPHAYNQDPQHYRQQSRHIVHELLPKVQFAESDICLSLDGELYGLPFDALYANDFLVYTHNFAYLNSFILYDLLDAPNVDKTDISLLYRSTFPKPLPDLHFVQEEVNNLSRHFGSERIGPEQQHDTAIVRQFSSAHVIHIAAHTVLDHEENPIIYLQNPISTAQLRFYHIYSPMVFLSACNTGSGKALPSEGMESVQRVFLGKGVPSVISTYWFANDETMLRLTSLFYEELYRHKKPVMSLANAKRIFLSKASVEHQNPWYWANINYSGIGNEIGLKKKTDDSVLMWIGGILCILIFIGIKYRGV